MTLKSHFKISLCKTTVFAFFLITTFQVCATDLQNSKPNSIPTFDLSPMVISSSKQQKYKNIDPQISAFSNASDLVFYGQVLAVEYQSAETDNDIGYPLTYISFTVFEVLQGTYTGSKINLMIPGMGQTRRNTFVFRSDRPIFAKDDELIVFLRKGLLNGPIYTHHFFVINDDIYDDQSCEIVIGEKDEILRGAVIPQEKIYERPLGVGTLRLIQEYSNKSSFRKKPTQNKNLAHTENSNFLPLNTDKFKELLLIKRKSQHLKKVKKQIKQDVSVRNQTLKSASISLPLFFSNKDGLVRKEK